jgi:hypothetical protein
MLKLRRQPYETLHKTPNLSQMLVSGVKFYSR